MCNKNVTGLNHGEKLSQKPAPHSHNFPHLRSAEKVWAVSFRLLPFKLVPGELDQTNRDQIKVGDVSASADPQAREWEENRAQRVGTYTENILFYSYRLSHSGAMEDEQSVNKHRKDN